MTQHWPFVVLFVVLTLAVTSAFGSALKPNQQRSLLRQTPGRSPLTRLVTFLKGGESSEILENVNGTSNQKREEDAFIRQSLLENVMFSELPEATLDQLVQGFEPIVYGKNQAIITQGQPSVDGDGAYVFLLAQGLCKVVVDGSEVPEPYGTLKPRAIIGELGVLYSKPRSATVLANSDQVLLYRVRGETFKTILNQVLHEDDPAVLLEIDQLITQVAGTKSRYGGAIIRQYEPSRRWLWKQWTGTVLQLNYKLVLANMALSLVVIVLSRKITGTPGWNMGLKPDPNHPWIQFLDIVRKLWGYQTSLTTFILTFFVSQSYTFWREILGTARGIQGRLSDFQMILATHCQRKSNGSYTAKAEQLMEDVGSYSRIFHSLFWASSASRFSALKTPRGLERMATRGLISKRQLQVLTSLDIPDNQLHTAAVEWMMIRCLEGMKDGTLCPDTAVRQRLLDQMEQLRGIYDSVGGKLRTRMPLPYTHFVQLLVDSFVLLSPVALYPELGAYSFFCVGVLTLFYAGLLDLAKVFLDPLENDGFFTKNSIDMDLGVFIRESNAASIRFRKAAASLPFDVTP